MRAPAWADNVATPGSHRSGYRPEIDGLRALAILPVVLFHAGFTTFSGGYVGVDIFFVISGFLITGILHREAEAGTFSIVRFYERRVRRIFPALFAMMAVVALVGTALLLPDEMRLLGSSILAATAFSSNILFWRQSGYFDDDAITKPLLHTWSLAVEEQFYILFPLVIWLVVRHRREWLLPIILAILLASLILSIGLVPRQPTFAFFMLPTRAWELLCGSVVALLPAATFRGRAVVTWASIATIMAVVLLYDERMPFPGLSAAPPCVATALIIWVSRDTSAGRFLSLPPLRQVGLISYSLYLWHWPIIVFLSFVYGSPLPIWAQATAVVGSFAAALLSWAYVERPLRRVKQVRTVWVTAALCIAGAVSVTGLTRASNGFPQRYSDDRLALIRDAEAGPAKRTQAYHCNAVKLSPAYRQLGPCRIGASSVRADLVVIGDSHAMALKPAFDTALRGKGRSGILFAVQGCPPIVDWQHPGDAGRCAEQMALILRYLEHKQVSAVMLVGKWRLQLGAGRLDRADRFRSSADSQMSEVAARLKTTVAMFRNRGVRVGVFLPVPGARLDVGRTLARGLGTPLTYSASEFRTAFRPLYDAVREARPDVTIDLASAFCDEICRVTDEDGGALYTDSNHVSDRGARHVVPQIAEMLESLSTR